ncbi:MAG: hypothetical protein Fur007_13920 [Rhodoferax sp.]
MKRSVVFLGLSMILSSVALAQSVDTAAAEALIKSNKCTKCHSIDKDKAGVPGYKKIAAKYKGKADAQAKLYTHLTTGPKVKVDGEEEEHVKIKAKDDAAIKNLIGFILSR